MAEIVPIVFHGNATPGPSLLPGELGPDLPFHGFSFLDGVVEINPQQIILEPINVHLVTRTALGESVREAASAIGVAESVAAHRLGDIRDILDTGNRAGFLLDCLISGVMHRTRQGDESSLILTKRRQEAVELAAKGYTNNDIREELGIGPRAAEHRFRDLYLKGQFRRRTLLTTAMLMTREQVAGLEIATLGLTT